MINKYYTGVDNSATPDDYEYNNKETVDVTATITISTKLSVDDYELSDSGINEDGHYSILDFSNCDLNKAFKEQVLPKLSSLNIDDYEVELVNRYKAI